MKQLVCALCVIHYSVGGECYYPSDFTDYISRVDQRQELNELPKATQLLEIPDSMLLGIPLTCLPLVWEASCGQNPAMFACMQHSLIRALLWRAHTGEGSGDLQEPPFAYRVCRSVLVGSQR